MPQITYTPRTCEKVLVAGRYDMFLVLSVDEDKQTADLMQLNHISCVMDSVPLIALRPFRPDIPVESYPEIGVGEVLDAGAESPFFPG